MLNRHSMVLVGPDTERAGDVLENWAIDNDKYPIKDEMYGMTINQFFSMLDKLPKGVMVDADCFYFLDEDEKPLTPDDIEDADYYSPNSVTFD